MVQRAMISVAGFRGIVGETLGAEDFFRYALAYGSLMESGAVAVGRDPRPSGDMLRDVVCGALVSTGCRVIDLGIVPTPTVGVMVRELGCRGGVAITASHNPIEWNALKFFRYDGALQRSKDHKKLLDIHASGRFRRARMTQPRSVQHRTDAAETHIRHVVENVGHEAIAARRFRVVIDCCNGAGTELHPALLDALNCDVTALFSEPLGRFERPPEPVRENLATLTRTVRDTGADLGFALDPDADRLAIIDERGRALGEERTLTLAAYHVLEREHSPFVVNLSTTRAADDVARLRDVRLHRSPVGEAHVVEAMSRRRAAIGGEGNGGVIWPTITPGRDAAAGIGLILDALAQRQCPVSALNRAVPDYAMLKQKLPLEPERLPEAFARLEKHFGRAEQVNRVDGLRIDLPEGWFHLRPSGTEPIVRLIVEASTFAEARQMAEDVSELI